MRTTLAISVCVSGSIMFGTAHAQKEVPIMDTDPQYFQQCQPLIDQQWNRHANRQSYRSTKVLNVESGPDYSTTVNGVESHDYCVAVAFIRSDGKYDLTDLRCQIWPDHAEIARAPCEAPSMQVWNAITRLAQQELTSEAANQWVRPYENGMPASLERFKNEQREMIQMNEAQAQRQRESECWHRGLDALRYFADTDPESYMRSGVDPRTFVDRVEQACLRGQ